MMIIALLNIAYYPNVEGGAEISTQKLAEELAKENEVYVICHGEKKTKEIINGVKVIRFPARIEYRNKLEQVFTKNYKIQLKKELKSVLNEIKPDVLHTNNLHAFSTIVWRIANNLNIPIVHTLRDYSLLNAVRVFDRWINVNASKRVDCVTAPSKFTLDKFLGEGFFTNSIIKKSIPNAIDYFERELDETISDKDKKSNEIVKFAYLGRYSPEKGVDWLVSTFHKCDINAELFLFGKGKLENKTEQIIKSDNRIMECGFLPEKELNKELIEKDVIVAPSLWDEPFGRIILDGYKNACPSIVTNRGGMPEVVEDKSTGLILRSETDEDLINALKYFGDRNNIRKTLPNIQKKIKDFSVKNQAMSFMQIYNRLQDEKK